MAEADRGEKWRLSKTVSVADLLAFVTAMAAVIFAWATLDKRISLIEASMVVQSRLDSRQDAEVSVMKAELRAELDRINQKLDRLIERK